MQPIIRLFLLGVLIASGMTVHAQAQQVASTAAAGSTASTSGPAAATGDLDEIVVHGIKRSELILPLNVGAFYNFQVHYTVKFQIYNLTDRRNLINDNPYYGNDSITRVAPRSYDLTLSGKF